MNATLAAAAVHPAARNAGHDATFAPAPSLDAQRAAFQRRRFLAMPLAGTLAWAAVGVAGAFASAGIATLTLYVATGSIVYLAMFLARFTGERVAFERKQKNVFDQLFLSTVAMAVLVYAIAIPFALQDRTSLPLSVGILTGLMWLPFAWLTQHWIGVFHALARTALILAVWFAFPSLRFVAVPAVIVAVYIVTIAVLERRWKAMV